MTAAEVIALRERTGLTQEGLARRMRLSVSTIRHWEQGLRHPDATRRLMLETIRDTLGKGEKK